MPQCVVELYGTKILIRFSFLFELRFSCACVSVLEFKYLRTFILALFALTTSIAKLSYRQISIFYSTQTQTQFMPRKQYLLFLTYKTEFILFFFFFFFFFFVVLDNSFLPIRQSLFYFHDSGNFYLGHGLIQLTHKSNVRILNFRSDVTFALPRKTLNGVRKRSL